MGSRGRCRRTVRIRVPTSVCGKVVDGAVQCPFHHWRFGGDGRCVSIPHLDKIPGTAKLQPYPTVEAYGYVWVWYGTPEPLFDLPDFPPLTSAAGDYVGFLYDDDTTGTVRHLLENAVDYQHFSALHGLDLDGIDYRVLTDPADAADNGAVLTRRDAWFGVWFAGRPAPTSVASAPVDRPQCGDRHVRDGGADGASRRRLARRSDGSPPTSTGRRCTRC